MYFFFIINIRSHDKHGRKRDQYRQKEKDSEKKKERKVDVETDRQTGRLTDRLIGRQIDINPERDWKKDKRVERETNRQTVTKIDKHKIKKKDRQRAKQKYRQKDRHIKMLPEKNLLSRPPQRDGLRQRASPKAERRQSGKGRSALYGKSEVEQDLVSLKALMSSLSKRIRNRELKKNKKVNKGRQGKIIFCGSPECKCMKVQIIA